MCTICTIAESYFLILVMFHEDCKNYMFICGSNVGKNDVYLFKICMVSKTPFSICLGKMKQILVVFLDFFWWIFYIRFNWFTCSKTWPGLVSDIEE